MSKRSKSICLWVFWKKSQKFCKICREEPVLGSFIVKLQLVMAYKRLLGQLYQKRDAYTETLTQILSVNFEKKYEHDYWHLWETASKIMSNILSFSWHFCIYFGEHKLSFYISTSPCSKKYNVFYFLVTTQLKCHVTF